MKKLILLVALSFTILSCTKEESKIDNQTRIKNDVPEELMGKWKIISEDASNRDPITGEFLDNIDSTPYDTGKDYDLWIKEYSICCINNEGCDQESYSYGQGGDGEGSFTLMPCDGRSGFLYFYTFDTENQDIVLIAESYGGGSWGGYKYQKVE